MIGLAPWWVVFVVMPLASVVCGIAFAMAARLTYTHVSVNEDEGEHSQ